MRNRTQATLPRLSANQAERKHSPYYVPAPWGNTERGELIEHGHSPTRAKRWARKNAQRRVMVPVL